MKTIIILFLLSSLIISVSAQDLSVYNRLVTNTGEYTPIPWLTYSYGDYFLDARYNFDQEKTYGVFVGKSFGPLTLAAGPMMGEYKAWSAESYISFSSQNDCMIFMYQYAWGNKGYFNFTYQWIEYLHSLSPTVSVGIGQQAYSDPSGAFVEAGPVAKIILGKIYIKPWVTYDFQNKFVKTFLGIGYLF